MRNSKTCKPQHNRIFDGKLLTFVMRHRPHRGAIMEMEIKVEGRNLVYSYKKLRQQH